MKQELFIIERTYNAPVSKVWKAISDKTQMKEWYFDVSDFKPEVGFEFQFTGENEGKTYVHLCKVVEVAHERKMKYSWQYKDYKGLSFVTFELFTEGDKTRLKLTHEGLETFPAVKDFAKESFEGGWNYIIGTSLKDYVEK